MLTIFLSLQYEKKYSVFKRRITGVIPLSQSFFDPFQFGNDIFNTSIASNRHVVDDDTMK